MILYHDGEEAPFYPEKVHPSDREPFWVSWAWAVGDDVSIISSEWILPTGFSLVDSIENSIVKSNCDEFTKAYGVVFSTSLTTGQHKIDNKITYLSAGEEYTLTRGFRFELGFI